jgi:hypothetical protein
MISESASQKFRESLRGQSFCPRENGYDSKLPELVKAVISNRCENSSHSCRVLFCQKLPI